MGVALSAFLIAFSLALFPAAAPVSAAQARTIPTAQTSWIYRAQKTPLSEIRIACTASREMENLTAKAQLCIHSDGNASQVFVTVAQDKRIACLQQQSSWCLVMFELNGAEAHLFPAQLQNASLAFSDAGRMPEQIAQSKSATILLNPDGLGERQFHFTTAGFNPAGFALREKLPAQKLASLR